MIIKVPQHFQARYYADISTKAIHYEGKVNGTARFFALTIIIDGTTEKVLQSIMPLKLIRNRNLGFIEQ
jgi:hypothetical protein